MTLAPGAIVGAAGISPVKVPVGAGSGIGSAYARADRAAAQSKVVNCMVIDGHGKKRNGVDRG